MNHHGRREYPSDEQLATLAELGLPEDRAIYLALQTMKKNSHKLSHEQIDRISDEVASKILHELKPAALHDWRPKVRQAVRDIVIGVIASGLWELFFYLSTHGLHVAGPEGPGAEDQRLESARWKLIRGMDNEDRKDLESQVMGLKEIFEDPFRAKCGNEIAQMSFFKELVEDNTKRKAPGDDNQLEREIQRQKEDMSYILLSELSDAYIDNLVPQAHHG